MALLVWLPLNGNLKNLGAAKVTVTNSGATIDNNGKIGKCYYFNGSSYIRISVPTGMTTIKNISICAWIKSTSSTLALGGISHDTDASKAGCTLYTSGWQLSGAGGWKYVSSGTIANTSTWHHTCCTIADNNITTYLDGVLIGTSSLSSLGVTTTGLTSSNFIEIGCDHPGGDEYLTGYVNDFRIYDHCLSPEEVSELAKGLVLHYKLDDGNANLLSKYVVPGQANPGSTSAGGRTIYNGDYSILIPATENADTYFRLFTTELLVSGNTYTISCNVSGLLSGTYYNFPLLAQGNTSMGVLLLNHNGLCSLTFTMNSTSLSTVTADGKTLYVCFMDDSTRAITTGQGPIIVSNFKLEKGSTATKWRPSFDDNLTKIYDSSGYGNYGTAIEEINTIIDSPLYNYATNFNGTNYIKSNFTLIMPEVSCVYWIKPNSNNGGYSIVSSNYNNPSSGFWIASNCESCGCWFYNGKYCGSSGLLDNNTWYHCCFVFNNGIGKWYINGIEKALGKNNLTSTTITISNLTIGNSYTGSSWNTKLYGNISDFRIYATALSAEDIRRLYEVEDTIRNNNSVHTFEYIETKDNLFSKVNMACAGRIYKDGLSSYTQSNCQVTLTKEGFRIYRPPNLTVSSNGNTMWGGLKIRNSTTDNVHVYNANTDNIWGLTKGHTYMFTCHIKGKSSNTFASVGWTNQMGWGGGGLSPNPSNVYYNNIPSNFNGEFDHYYLFTINDDVVKTCTSSYSNFVKDSKYMSYYDLMLGFAYTDTGTLGTDLYLTNFKLYDITNEISLYINNKGQMMFAELVEQNGITQFKKDGEIISSHFIEI